MITALAPAKINLTLHVTGRRSDGYHLLDSLVVFADCGDVLHMRPGALNLTLQGPEAGALEAEPDNLILRAARLAGLEAQMALEKNLPVASGLGGGSSDAAAALRGLAALHGTPVPDALSLGADLPMCLAATPLRAQGIGEQITPLPPLPPLWVVLVNPRVAVPTGPVFAALGADGAMGAPMPDLPRFTGVADLAQFLQDQRNDLEAPATKLCPPIADCLAALRATTPLVARMSGSGASCFGLYASAHAAQMAAERLSGSDWWVRHSAVLPPQPQLIRSTT